MAYVSIIAGQLQQLLISRRWECHVDRFRMECVEPALEPIRHVWLAGDAASMSEGEILQARPSRVIVQDLAPAQEVTRIGAAMELAGRSATVERFTRFVDRIWDASRAAERARKDAELQDSLFEMLPVEATPHDRHVPQIIKLGKDSVSDSRVLDAALAVEGSCLVLVAEAGLGKSEFLQWQEWRYAVFYQSATTQDSPHLPPIALRVPLRGLRSLSLDGIAHYLSHPDTDDGLPQLPSLDSGACLLELLRLQRVILLLDGLDELAIGKDKLDQGIREIRRAVADGARVVFSSRQGHLASSRSIESTFREDEVARIDPMPASAGHLLLRRYGATEEEAEEILSRLTLSPAQGIPLFLLMAYTVRLNRELPAETLTSKTKVLLELIRLFCVRDEPRLGVSEEDQLRILTEFAHWTSLVGELNQASALEYLGIDADDADAAVIANPHALLGRSASDAILFRYPQFYSIFYAKALADDWTAMGVESILEDLRGHKLDDGIIEYLARLVSPSQIQAAWVQSTGRGTFTRWPLVRRNILALALAYLEDTTAGATPRARSTRLAEVIGSTVLEDVSLSELSLVRLDLSNWTIRRIQGKGGALLYCSGLEACDYDDSIWTLDSTEGSVFPTDDDEGPAIRAGRERLLELVRPIRRKGVESMGLIPFLALEECRDMVGWEEVRKAKFASISKPHGNRSFVLTKRGLRSIGAFLRANLESEAAMAHLLRTDGELRTLLLSLGRDA